MLQLCHTQSDHHFPEVIQSLPQLCSQQAIYNSILGSTFYNNSATFGGALYLKASNEQCINPDQGCYTVRIQKSN